MATSIYVFDLIFTLSWGEMGDEQVLLAEKHFHSAVVFIERQFFFPSDAPRAKNISTERKKWNLSIERKGKTEIKGIKSSFTRGNEWENHRLCCCCFLCFLSLFFSFKFRIDEEENKYKNYFNLFRFFCIFTSFVIILTFIFFV